MQQKQNIYTTKTSINYIFDSPSLQVTHCIKSTFYVAAISQHSSVLYTFNLEYILDLEGIALYMRGGKCLKNEAGLRPVLQSQVTNFP